VHEIDPEIRESAGIAQPLPYTFGAGRVELPRIRTVTVCSRADRSCVRACKREEIDRSIAIVVETSQNLNRAFFPLKSKAKKFDGRSVGFGPSAEKFAHKNQSVTMLRNKRVGVRTRRSHRT
jgi:hypothetical protein